MLLRLRERFRCWAGFRVVLTRKGIDAMCKAYKKGRKKRRDASDDEAETSADESRADPGTGESEQTASAIGRRAGTLGRGTSDEEGGDLDRLWRTSRQTTQGRRRGRVGADAQGETREGAGLCGDQQLISRRRCVQQRDWEQQQGPSRLGGIICYQYGLRPSSQQCGGRWDVPGVPVRISFSVSGSYVGKTAKVADHTHKEPCTKIARAGTCSFLPISYSRFVFFLYYNFARISPGRPPGHLACLARISPHSAASGGGTSSGSGSGSTRLMYTPLPT